MAKRRLTQRRINTLKPKQHAFVLRDSKLKGFGIRVLPSGAKRYFVHTQHRGRRIWKDIGDANTITETNARQHAVSVLTIIRSGTCSITAAPNLTRFETVAEEVFRRYARHWKPRTLSVNLGYYKTQILPWFKGRQIADIKCNDVQRWFASRHATPSAADRSAPVLSVIMQQAEVYGYRPEGTNPCVGIRRYRRRSRERFLTPEEMRRLSDVLRHYEARWSQPVAIIRLLLLTGCRKSEIMTLEWSSYRDGNLYLPDSKTGPRTVWLSSAARRVLDGLPRTRRWVFPGRNLRSPVTNVNRIWNYMRAEADLGDVRLHDLRHSYASVALARGETVLTIGKLLGHADPGTTLKYTHLADATVQQAADVVGAVLGGGH